jgi:hypothetical protein
MRHLWRVMRLRIIFRTQIEVFLRPFLEPQLVRLDDAGCQARGMCLRLKGASRPQDALTSQMIYSI